MQACMYMKHRLYTLFKWLFIVKFVYYWRCTIHLLGRKRKRVSQLGVEFVSSFKTDILS